MPKATEFEKLLFEEDKSPYVDIFEELWEQKQRKSKPRYTVPKIAPRLPGVKRPAPAVTTEASKKMKKDIN
jgi:hypothetical protein